MLTNWTAEQIRDILAHPDQKTGVRENRYLIYRMLQALYQRQTRYEQDAEHTEEHNGRGFNGPDSHLLTKVAKKSLPYQNLTIKQCVWLAPRLKKYAKQLELIASEKLTQRTLVGTIR